MFLATRNFKKCSLTLESVSLITRIFNKTFLKIKFILQFLIFKTVLSRSFFVLMNSDLIFRNIFKCYNI